MEETKELKPVSTNQKPTVEHVELPVDGFFDVQEVLVAKEEWP